MDNFLIVKMIFSITVQRLRVNKFETTIAQIDFLVMNLEKRELEMQIIEAQGNVLALPYKNTLAVSLFFQKKMKIGP